MAMQQTETTARRDRQGLRYLDASCVTHPAGSLKGIEVCKRNDASIGEIVGVLVEPARRSVRYFVVERHSLLKRRRYLLPADCLATLHAGGGTIYIDVDNPVTERFDESSVPPFSDDDLVETMFATTAA